MSEEQRPYNAVDKINLASLMIEWYHKKRELDSIERTIKSFVTRLGETVDVANIRCTFNSGRTKYQGWQQAVNNTFDDFDAEMEAEIEDYVNDLIPDFSEDVTTTKTDWKAVCEALGIEREVVSHGTPSATLKVIDD